MEYKVIPFVASVDSKNSKPEYVAQQLEELINSYSSEGWEYARLESVTTFVQPDNGCFGFGAKPGYTTSRQMIVFKR
ncbi:DUF4177 domain-containing protein [Galbibacter sp. EGI 63066]|uniref:DUF4177 domain-containing protein n=1 Tax=Galbibacter sp. EGI 63066 TaxID=2993559 RepID=UPI002248B311|nr:DUF4177 domain-containing protein [Galbibacter sp. EGI 63066]MCX2681765.1 DUF4177 domain-containing protein [Galbibacter sp. EGI 63066]